MIIYNTSISSNAMDMGWLLPQPMDILERFISLYGTYISTILAHKTKNMAYLIAVLGIASVLS